MSQPESNGSHPYQQYVGTFEWLVIDKALLDLAENGDLKETTGHEYIVGYLCKALVEHEGLQSADSTP